MSLKKYQQKRVFKKTNEPVGKVVQKNKAECSHFVIQKHRSSHLHFDFRLEAEGVLKSWAVPKGLPAPGQKHLAMMVEDHPLEYQNFEGIIEPGNYGAGEVIIWDRGTYFLRNEPDNSALPKKIKKGEFGFSLFGQKIKGSFSMVRFKKAKGNSWLLIGRSAEDQEQFENDHSVVSGLGIEEIEKQKIEIEKFPQARKASMPDFVSPMLTTLVEKPFDDEKWSFELKLDGYRTIARKKNDKINLYSRNNKNFNEIFFPIAESLKKIEGDFILDGEVVVIDHKGVSSFQLLQNYLTKRKGSLVYYVFDIVHLDGYDLKNVALNQRREVLHTILEKDLKVIRNIKIIKSIEKEGVALFQAAVKNGVEGIVGKKTASIYRESNRSSDWIKIKTSLSQDAVICGYTQPKGRRKKFGALILGVYENEKLTYIGHVGGGFNDNNLELINNKLQPLISKKSPFEEIPKTNTPVTWVRPEFVCIVKFSQWTDEGVMRQPIFLGLRADKNPQEVQREIPTKKENVLKNKRKFYAVKDEEKIEEHIAGKKLILTNLKKIYWPEEGYSKGDLVDYYKKISKYILPYIKNRPQSLNRFPDGIFGKSFFQKDMPDAPPWIKTISIYSSSEERNIEYMICNSQADLIYMVNLGCIEINVWNSSIAHLDHPDYVVMDIDPQNLPFSSAVIVAQETKKILDKISVVGFCKTSGSRGLHIFIPLAKQYTYDQVKDFSKLINMIINLRLPDITSIERKPNARDKKVYLDFLQNRKGQTMAAAYCVRPKPGAPVSTPLDWEELNSNLDPKEFNIKTIFSRLEKKGDLWKGMQSRRVDLSEAVGFLEKLMSGETKPLRKM